VANLAGEGGLMEYVVKTTEGRASFCRVRAQ
jgi:hypothetical protein